MTLSLQDMTKAMPCPAVVPCTVRDWRGLSPCRAVAGRFRASPCPAELSRHKMQGCTMAALRGKFVSTIYACVVVSVASVMVATPFVTVTVYVLRLSPVTV